MPAHGEALLGRRLSGEVLCRGQEVESLRECPDFPCEVLSNMGKDQGFDPLPKIEMCRKWAAESENKNN
jgi:hypothetical protein